MGASVGAENIAIAIETSADTSGIASARSNVDALSKATVTATNEMIAATDRAAQSETSFAAAVAQASTATESDIALRTRFNALMAEHGNDMQRVAAILLQEQAAEAQAAQASVQHAVALQEEAAAAAQAATELTQEAAAVQQSAEADKIAAVSAEELVAATEAKAAATANADGQMKKIPASARTAANALSVLTQAAVAGQGGMSGIANASGALAFGVASLIPQFALLATGVGAVVTIGTLLYQVWERQAEARERLNQAIIAGLASDPALEAHLKAERDAADAAAAAIQREADAMARRRAQDEQRAQSIAATLEEETAAAIDRTTKTEDEAAAARIIRAERRREEEIRQLEIDEDEKTALILAAQADRDAQLAEMAARAREREAEEKKRQDDEERRRAQQAADEFERITLQGVESAIKNSDSYIQAVTRALLTPIVNWLEAAAEQEIVQAAISAAHLDFVGAARHAGVAALAIGAERKVASIGGLNGSGGGGSASASGGYVGGSTFTPSERDGGQQVTVNLFTTDPYGRENIAKTSYYLTRNGTLNTPIYVPPTTGVRAA